MRLIDVDNPNLYSQIDAIPPDIGYRSWLPARNLILGLKNISGVSAGVNYIWICGRQPSAIPDHEEELMTQLNYLVSERQYQAELNGEIVGTVDYSMDGHKVIIHRTHTHADARGRGVARMLTRYVLDDVRERGFSAVPHCDYTKRFLRDHPEYTDVTMA